MSAVEALVRELLPVVRGFVAGEGAYGVALGGSHAKGAGDALSDVDVYLFAARVLPGAERAERVRLTPGAEEAVSWGVDEPFVQGGTDFRLRGQAVECWLRHPDWIESLIGDAWEGRIRREYSGWAVSGFFGHTALADVHSMRIVEDPHRLLATWKAELGSYPEALRRALVERFSREAEFWPENPHYRSAVERADALYTSAIVQQVVQALVQVVFAQNRAYFPGDKHLARWLAPLPVQPADFAGRARALLFPGARPTPAVLEAQRRALTALVQEVLALVPRAP